VLDFGGADQAAMQLLELAHARDQQAVLSGDPAIG
jgi:hypothetical protein